MTTTVEPAVEDYRNPYVTLWEAKWGPPFVGALLVAGICVGPHVANAIIDHRAELARQEALRNPATPDDCQRPLNIGTWTLAQGATVRYSPIELDRAVSNAISPLPRDVSFAWEVCESTDENGQTWISFSSRELGAIAGMDFSGDANGTVAVLRDNLTPPEGYIPADVTIDALRG